MNVVFMEYCILKSPVSAAEINYKNTRLVKNDHKLSVHDVSFSVCMRLLKDYMMKITFIDISVV